jgi:beta-1,4-N-acetylglucosaminyltransferase
VRICIVSSCGGHLAEVRALKRAYGRYEHFYVLNDHITLPSDMEGRTYFIWHSERDWKLIVNLWEAWLIFRRERPDVVLSTGAGLAVPFGAIARLLRITVIFVESCAQVSRPSLTGRIMYFLAHRFFYQWEELARYYPHGVFGGLVL